MCRRFLLFATVIACFITGTIASTWWARYSHIPAPIIAQKGLATVMDESGKYGFIDKTGKMIWAPSN